MNGEAGVVTIAIGKSASNSLKPKEIIFSTWLRGRLLEAASSQSYRSAARNFNADTFRSDADDGAISHTTLQYLVEHEGNDIHNSFVAESARVLAASGCDVSTGAPVRSEDARGAASVRAKTQEDKPVEVSGEVLKVVEKLNVNKDGSPKQDAFKVKDPSLILDAQRSASMKDDLVYIAHDGVLTHKQREERCERGRHSPREGRKWVETTSTAIVYGGEACRFPARSQSEAGMLTSAVIHANGLQDKRLEFFSDGAKCIRQNVDAVWGDRVAGYYLDCLHLKKKIDERISSGCKGSLDDKKAMRSKLFSIIFAGNVDDFIQEVRNIPKKIVKNQASLDNLVQYVESRRDIIPCYALRKALGLKISSNESELSNRVLVTQRCKNAAMSWSNDGCLGLAAVTASIRNGTLYQILRNKTTRLDFFKKESDQLSTTSALDCTHGVAV